MSLFLGFAFVIIGLIIGIIFIIIGIITNSHRKTTQEIVDGLEDNKQSETNPIDVLKMRFAKGEITKEEFEEMKKDLK